MNTNLSQAQIVSYQENGFLVVKNFLSASELEEWRDAVDAAVSGRGKEKLPAGAPGRQDNDKGVFIQKMNLWMDNEAVKRCILDPRIGEMCCTLAGVEAIRIWLDQALIKAPWANATSFHLDCPFWSFHAPNAISIWVALDDATQQNGCLYYLPGTHKKQSYDNAGTSGNIGNLFKQHPEWQTIEPAVAEMKAGDCGFHNGLTAHGAGANMTPRYRRAMTGAFMPEGSIFNGQQDILSAEQVAQLSVGDILQDDQQNPIVYASGRKMNAGIYP